MRERFVVSYGEHGLDLDEFLALRFPTARRSALRGLVREGAVRVNGTVRGGGLVLRRDALVEIDLPEEGLREHAKPPEPIVVLREDEHLLLVAKPSGIPVEGERWRREAPTVRTRLEESRGREADEPSEGELRVVHRLDKETTGVLALAKTPEAERELRRQFDERTVEKEYLAVVEGEVPQEEGTIDAPIEEDAERPGRMRVGAKGKEARTDWEVEERFRGFTALAVFPRTGRTHQIRVHLASIGFPLVVDPLYGGRESFLLSSIKPGYKRKVGRPERPLLSRIALHARRLALRSPAGERVAVEAPLPRDLAVLLRNLRRWRSRA